MSDDDKKNEGVPDAQTNQAGYPGPGAWPGMAAPWGAYPGWGPGHFHHAHPEAAQHPGATGPWPGCHPGHGWAGPAMVWWATPPAQAGANPGPAWPGPAPVWAQPQPPASPQAQAADNGSFFSSGLGVHNDALVKGLLIGAGVAYLLTNETVQKNLMSTAIKLWSAFQGGVEEVKERFRDAEAEAHSNETR
jgi:hypothetical protein